MTYFTFGNIDIRVDAALRACRHAFPANSVAWIRKLDSDQRHDSIRRDIEPHGFQSLSSRYVIVDRGQIPRISSDTILSHFDEVWILGSMTVESRLDTIADFSLTTDAGKLVEGSERLAQIREAAAIIPLLAAVADGSEGLNYFTTDEDLTALIRGCDME